MKHKKYIIIIVILILMITIGILIYGTYAYFRNNKENINTFTMGEVEIKVEEPNYKEDKSKRLMPGVTIIKDPTIIGIKGTSYARMIITIEDIEGNNIYDEKRLELIKNTIYYDKEYNKKETPNLKEDKMYSKKEIERLIEEEKIEEGYNKSKFTYDIKRSRSNKLYYNYNGLLEALEEGVLFTDIVIPTDYTAEDIELMGDFNLDITIEGIQNVGFETKEIALSQLDKEVYPNPSDLFNDSLTAIRYENHNWVVVDPEKDMWYDYDRQEWANAVILNPGINKEPGDILTMDEIKAMYVWIPRYSYTIKKEYGVRLEGGDSLSKSTPGAIDIKFVSTNIKEKGIPTYSSDIASGWLTHPAFTFGNQDLSGIWVGKFETTGNIYAPTIKPNLKSIRNEVISSQFNAAKLLNQYVTNSDNHISKDSEWGAVAYFSQSKYGKYGNKNYIKANKEIYMNPTGGNSTTGISSGTPNTIVSQCNYDDIKNRGNGLGSCGGGASTTGNIYGIYDMNGGALEWSMGNYNKNTAKSGIDFNILNPKYYDLYTSRNLEEACNGAPCYGYGTFETNGWYDDLMSFFQGCPVNWNERGGWGNRSSGDSGIFSSACNGSDGGRNTNNSFRIILVPAEDS